MKYAEVGRIRVGYDDAGEGATVIDHPSLEHPRPMMLEPGELQDLVVALDIVQGHTQPCSRTDLPHEIVKALRAASHALKVAGLRHKLELHVERYKLLDIAAIADVVPVKYRPDTLHLDLGGFRLVARCGVHP